MNNREFQWVHDWIAPRSRVLDLGCGDGSFLAHLHRSRDVRGYGLEISTANICKCIAAGVNVIQADLDQGLATFDTDTFDTVFLLQTLQAIRYPEALLNEMLRVGREGIVTFPNFGHWHNRLQLALKGRMPVTTSLPAQWYETENIHLCTLGDFESLCRKNAIRIVDRLILSAGSEPSFAGRIWPGLFGATALYRIRRS